MKTLVETYEVEEVSNEAAAMAADSEAIALAQKLGLSGQLALTDTKTDTRCPYRKMTAEERFVYRMLCPERTPLALYKEGPIPLRVLQVASHAIETGMYWDLHVWHPSSRLEKDPVLVGHFKTGVDKWYHDFHILARWGDELPHVSELMPRAKKKWVEAAKAQLLKTQMKVREHLATLEAIAQTEALPEDVTMPHYVFNP